MRLGKLGLETVRRFLQHFPKPPISRRFPAANNFETHGVLLSAASLRRAPGFKEKHRTLRSARPARCFAGFTKQGGCHASHSTSPQQRCQHLFFTLDIPQQKCYTWKVRYLIDSILPVQQVHLVAGPTGAGKTTWLLQTLLDWHRGKPVLGFCSHPCRWAYIAADRTAQDALMTVMRMGIGPAELPFIPARDQHLGTSGILDAIERRAAGGAPADRRHGRHPADRG